MWRSGHEICMLTTSTGRMSKQQVQVVRPTFMTLDHKNEVECISVVNSLVSCPVFLTWALVLHTNCRELTSRFRWQRLPLLTHCCHCSGGSSESGEIHRRQWRRRHLFNGRTTKCKSRVTWTIQKALRAMGQKQIVH